MGGGIFQTKQEEANLVEKVNVKHVVRSSFEVTRNKLVGIIYKELNVLVEENTEMDVYQKESYGLRRIKIRRC